GEEAIGRRLDELFIPPSYRPAHRHGLEHFLATGTGRALGQRLELTALDRWGREFPIELKVWAIQEGSSWSFNAFIRDVSERKQAEDVAARLVAVVENSTDAVLTLAADGTILQW